MKLPLASFRLKNFKAVRDSGVVKFTPLTVFIGNNGSGKSSLIEALQTYRDIVVNGIDEAMNRWRGFEYIHNPPIDVFTSASKRTKRIKPIEFILDGDVSPSYRTEIKINMTTNGDTVYIQEEGINVRGKRLLFRDEGGRVTKGDGNVLIKEGMLSNVSLLHPTIALGNYGQGINEVSRILALTSSIGAWQFLTLNPYRMGEPYPRQRTGGKVKLEPDGANIADYLLDIRQRSPEAFEGIVETLQYVLPYARDFQPALASELQRSAYLQLTESGFKVPGWLLSTGTLRIAALLALLRDPDPPPLIAIEEIENGLDPRTIHLIVEELRAFVENEMTQVIITTHSPYLLDLLALSQIVLVERIDGQPRFFRPGDHEELNEWAKSFGPGRLYTMNRLRSEAADENRDDL